jgi:hypothetical protein
MYHWARILPQGLKERVEAMSEPAATLFPLLPLPRQHRLRISP